MEKEKIEFASAKVDEMLAAACASAETKKAAQDWKDAISSGGDADDATNALMDSISTKQTSIDNLIAFASSETGKQIFGDAADEVIAHAKKRQSEGGKWCDCAACRPCHELLAEFGREEPDVYL